MKKILLFIICSFLSASTFSVEGMTCGVGCANKIKMQMDTLDGVKLCDVNFETGIMTVEYDDSKLNDQKIISHLTSNTTYKVALTTDGSTKNKTTSQKSCCSEKEKVGFFKKLFSWF